MPVLRRPDLLAEGWTDRELRRRRNRGELRSVCRGAYLLDGDERLDDRARHHALRVTAPSPLLSPDVVVSHVSAAVLHGLAVWGLPLGRVHHTRDRRAGSRRTPTRHRHAAPLRPQDVVGVGGVAVTSVARTLDDLARSAASARPWPCSTTPCTAASSTQLSWPRSWPGRPDGGVPRLPAARSGSRTGAA